MPLSDTAIRKAKGREKPYRLTDEKGLYVLVQPDGARWWRLSDGLAAEAASAPRLQDLNKSVTVPVAMAALPELPRQLSSKADVSGFRWERRLAIVETPS